MDFLDVILEAKGNKRRTTTPRATRIDTTKGNDDTTDYTGEETDENETIDTTNETDDDTTDYTSATDDSTDEEGITDDDSVDYTAEEEESDPEEDGADSTDDVTDDATDDDTESTDYTENNDDDSDSADNYGEGDDSGDSESDTEEDPKEKENMRILLEDFTNLYFMVRNTITKLSNIDKSNAVINKIVSQISSNLNILKKQLFDFIIFNFPKGKYVTNLYKYNYFLEAFKINVEMLKKINVFTTNSQNN
jgi:hypothetical protein